MKRLACSVVLLFLVSGVVMAQSEFTRRDTFRREPTKSDRIEIALASGLVASSVWDVQTTISALNRCAPYCVEANPLMRGNRIWVTQGGLTAGVVMLSHQLKGRTKLWWLPLATNIAWHVGAATHNNRLPTYR